MALLSPLVALVVSFVFLAAMLFKRAGIGVTLVSTAIVMSLLSMELPQISQAWVETTLDPVTMSLVLVTLGIMLLSLLYKETKAIDSLSESFGGLLRNSKLVVSALPAIMGLLPVPGGALMSAPLVEKEAERLGLEGDKKTYVNVWFRHIIFPIYPMSQILILTASLTQVSLTSIIISQVPVVVAMAIVGYFTVLRKAKANDGRAQRRNLRENSTSFLLSFSPILIMILAVVILGIDVAVSALIGIIVLILIMRPSLKILTKVISDLSIYKIALAAYGAMLLRNAIIFSGVSEILGQAVASSNLNEVVLLLTLPATLGFIAGLPTVGIAISVPILAGSIAFTGSSASLLFMSAYLGYLAAPTHLCLALTADYFKCSLSKAYRYLAPSLAASFTVALLAYYIL